MNYAFLRQQGIQYLEQLAGKVWTDFNSHDPGITILEQICYALTDLAYRIDYPLPDLLAGDASALGDTLFTPSQILPTDPVTLLDWRKLVIDVPGVRNAWVEATDRETPQTPLYYDECNHTLRLTGDPLVAESVRLRGLYRVLVDIFAGAAESQQTILDAVRQRLHAHRGLCQDFVAIDAIAPQEVGVRATVEIEAVEDPETLLLTILKRLAYHISPPVQFYTLRQLLDADKRIDEIFDGPLLTHGFIDDHALKNSQRRTELRTSDLIREIMDVTGVKAVRTITLAKITGQQKGWSLTLDADKAPRLKSPKITALGELNTEIELRRNGLPVRVDLTRVISEFEHWRRFTAFQKSPPPDTSPDHLPTGRDRHVGRYDSIQYQFPTTYGIGELGLPASASQRRQAQAKQLKAYLLFFDQLLANSFAQLAHVKDLFSAAPPTNHTYFSQPLDDPSLDLDGIIQLSPEGLQQLTENSGLTRRNRFLNHVLARFAAQFNDYALIPELGIVPGEEQLTPDNIVRDKQAFLQAYPVLSRTRGTGFNYLRPWSEENQSGLEKQLRHTLGLIEPEERFIMVEHILLRPMAEDKTQTVPILEGNGEVFLTSDPYSLQLSFILPGENGRFVKPDSDSPSPFRTFVERTIREETPAHLAVTVQWCDQANEEGVLTFEELENAYHNWLDKRRAHWLSE